MREVRETPVGLIDRILFYRGYANAKQMYDSAHASGPEAIKALPDSPFLDLVQEIEFDDVREAMRAGG